MQRLSATERAAERLTDGQWHRLHPATPLLRGGFAFVAVLGIVLSNLRERLVGFLMGQPDYGGDPIDQIYDHGLVGIALGIIALVLILCIALFYLSWRMHSFRIGEEAVEVRSGVLFRSYRKARLDRIQSINVVRPLFARLFGAAKLEVSVAGHDANVHLSYLSSALADALRRDVLRRASGVRAAEEAAAAAQVAPAPASGLVARRVGELIAPELDPDAAPIESVVRIPPVRLFGSLILSGFTIFLLVVLGLLLGGAAAGKLWLLIVFLPAVIGWAGVYLRRFTKSLRYSIAGTDDGIRIGFGLLTLSNATLPPGRIHAVEVSQPVLWRPFRWWQVRIDTAGHSHERGAAGHHETTILPVGTLADARRVFELALPGFEAEGGSELIEAGMISKGRDDFIGAPRRARWVRPFSWRRTGYRMVPGAILLRHGFFRRRLIVVPLARLQSLELHQGPLGRGLRLAGARFHTVEGPVRPRLPVIDLARAAVLFDEVASGAVDAAARDTTHRWNEAGQA